MYLIKLIDFGRNWTPILRLIKMPLKLRFVLFDFTIRMKLVFVFRRA